MASWHSTELLLIFVIALLILGPKRLPEIANTVGGWVGKARRMTRILKRQLEEEVDIEKGLNVRPKIQAYVPPNDDDTFSPMHPPEGAMKVEAEVDSAEDQPEPSSDQPETTEQPEPAATDEAATEDDGDRKET